MDANPYKIVLCEDEPLLLENLRRKVEKVADGYEVCATATDGLQALGTLETHCADVLITDIRMPVMDGMALLEAVRNANLGVRCILLSGYSDFEYARAALRLGAVEYLLKPVAEAELRQVLIGQRLALDAQRDRYRKQLSLSAEHSIEDTLALMRQFIHTHMRETIQFNLLTANLHYSAAYMTRQFAKRYGIPPQRYQTQLRMNEAKRLLTRLPEQSVRDIAAYLGYEDQGYFTRIFKQVTGISPQQYRERGE